MIRKTLLSAATVFALVLGVLAAPASADPTTVPDATAIPANCNNLSEYNAALQNCLVYPDGGFGSGSSAGEATATSTPAPFPTPTVIPVEVTATGGAGEATIAFTGAESRVLGYVGAGFIGFGAVALAAARRKNETNLD